MWNTKKRGLALLILFVPLLASLPVSGGQDPSAPASPPRNTSLPDLIPDANGNLSQEQMRQLVMANGFDEAKVREMAAQHTQTLTELTVQRARVESEMYQVLTPDQKTKLSTIITQHDIIDVPEASMFGRSRIMRTLASGLISGMSSAVSGPMTYLPNRVIY